MLGMLLLCLAIEKNVIEVHYNEPIQVRIEQFFHKGAERGRGVSQAEGHYEKFVSSVPRHARCLWLVSFGDPHLVVPRS